MSVDKQSSIRVRHSTLERLKDLGWKGESYDMIIIWLLDHSKKRVKSHVKV